MLKMLPLMPAMNISISCFLLRFVQSCCLPEDKLSYIRSSQGLGNKICMINAVTGTLKYPLNFSWVLGDAEVDEDEE